MKILLTALLIVFLLGCKSVPRKWQHPDYDAIHVVYDYVLDRGNELESKWQYYAGAYNVDSMKHYSARLSETVRTINYLYNLMWKKPAK